MNTPKSLQIPPLDRRRFLELAGRGLGFSALTTLLPGCSGGGGGGGTGGGAMGLPPASAEVQALRRISFGISPDELAAINNVGVTDYLEQQLDYLSIDDSTVEAAVANSFPLAMESPAILFQGFPGNFQAIVEDLVGATTYRAFFSPRQLYEVMVEFWTNHFSIHLINGIIPILKPYDDATVIRPNALGNFRTLLQASAKSPAMLYYLDNFLNFVGEPQENYARELLELHTLGVDNFSEADVKEVARCFTGWTINQQTYEFQFISALHDQDEKNVLGTLIPAGGGITDGETVLNLLANNPATARFVATKLCRRFIDDDPPATLIDAVAASYTQTDGDIPDMLRVIFASPEFAGLQDRKLTRPMEFLGGLLRALNINQTLPADDGRLYFLVLSVLAQVPFYWVPPNGYPDVGAYWGSTSGFLNRWRIALALNAPGIQDYFPTAHTVAGTGNIAEVIDSVAASLLFRELAVEDRDLLIDWLVTELGVAADTPLDQATVEALAPFVVSMLASSVYFQLR